MSRGPGSNDGAEKTVANNVSTILAKLQVAKIEAVRDQLPSLRQIVVIDPAGVGDRAIALDELRARGSRREPAELDARTGAVAKADPYTFIYTSGTTGPPKGCVLSHGNYRAVLDMVAERGIVSSPDDLIYLFLPLAHAFGLLRPRWLEPNKRQCRSQQGSAMQEVAAIHRHSGHGSLPEQLFVCYGL